MREPARRTRANFVAAAIAVATLAGAETVRAAKPTWDPVDPAWLTITEPAVEPDADAEVLLWKVRITDSLGDSFRAGYDHLLRIKLFNAAAIESQAKVDIPYGSDVKVEDVMGRTIQTDGTVVELAPSGVYDRTIVRAGRARVRAKSFALPAVVPGSIVEYRWHESWEFHFSAYERLVFARDIPVRNVTYLLRLRGVPGWKMAARSFHTKPVEVVREDDGYSRITLENVPAVREEPFMPPRTMVEPWVLLFYMEGMRTDTQRYWKDAARDAWLDAKPYLKPSGEIERTAQAVTAGATGPEAKLEKLIEWTRSNVKLVDADDLSPEELKRWRDRKRSAARTHEERTADALDLKHLFASLALASGFDARLAKAADRSRFFFDPSFPDLYFLRIPLVAVKVGEAWRMYDPSARGLPAGMLPWYTEGEQVLVTDPKEGFFVETPMSSADENRHHSLATLTLLADGSVEGDVREVMTGQHALAAVSDAAGMSVEERKKALEEQVHEDLPGAEISEIRLDEPSEAAGVARSYHVRLPAYASRTGRRMFVQPAFFQHGGEPVFPGAQRRFPIHIAHSTVAEDVVKLQLPEGFGLEMPEDVKGGSVTGGKVVKYELDLSASEDGRSISCRRTLRLDGGRRILYMPVESYLPLKNVFDQIHREDQRVVVLARAQPRVSEAEVSP